MTVTGFGTNRGWAMVAALVVGSLALAACSSDGGSWTSSSISTAPAAADRPPAETPMRASAVATKRRLLIGAAVAVDPLRDEKRYRQTLAREYNAVTPENAMKWDTIHPEPDRYDFGPADSIVEFARDHHMAVRGHTLVWYRQVPSWVTDRSWTRDQLEQVLHDHIRTVVGHYRGKIAQWDVVNEAVDDKGRPRDSVWMRVIGPDYIDLAFKWAHEADPDAQLYYNDYDTEYPSDKANAVRELVRGLEARGAPIDGVGIQAHELTVRSATPAMLGAAIASFTDAGLDVAITEADVGIFLPAKPKHLDEQAEIYRNLLDACLAARRCTAFVTWGFTDRHSWIPGEIKGFGDALPFDADYRPTPALRALRTGLAGRRSG
jgi:endo-1,4-beta-xylanase